MIHASAIIKGTDFRIEPVFEQELDELLRLCRENLSQVDEDMIRQAFRLGYWAHRNDRRATGEPYFIHPIAVAKIAASKIRFDDISVAAALMHDVVEDTEVGLDFIGEVFGETMMNIIDGLTKISGVFSSRRVNQAENVRKLMLSMASDIRVILVKFADRLHNMQTIDSLPPPKQQKIASETLDLFAPLAHRFGLNSIKNDLEDLSLRVIDGKAYYEIVDGLRATREQRLRIVDAFIQPIEARLQAQRFPFEMYGRAKNIYSIYRKMKRQKKPLSEIYDLHAVRIILETEGAQGREDCWRVYSIITAEYQPIPERYRDFISVPKSNGYQSLHTTVLGPEGSRIEVQIRTREMHEIAERGVAAHWKYKEGVDRADQQMEQLLTWMRELLDNPDPEQATEFVKDFRLNLYDEEIYVFTPKGDLVTLPSGATPVDFAFQIHSEVGSHCLGAKVNGKLVPLSYKLKSGDQIEVITSKKQTPNPDWMNFVVTHKARSRIRHWMNEKKRNAINHGRDIWHRKARKAKVEVSEHDLQRHAAKLRYRNQQDMFYEIGVGKFNPDELITFIKNGERAPKEEPASSNPQLQFESFLGTAQSNGRPALLIDGELHTDIATRYAACCNPIPGDDVFGFINKTGAITIHRVNCQNAPNLFINNPDRIMQVEWSRHKDVQFVSALRIMGEDRVGMLSDVTTVISKNLKTNIRSITVDSQDGVFEGTLVIYVSDLDHLRRLIERLKRIQGVYGVYRFEEQADEAL